MRHLMIAGSILAAAVLALTGCPVAPTGVTVDGSFVGSYFNITGDVTVTVDLGGTAFTVVAPVSSGLSSQQLGAFLIANVPTGTYSVTVTFQNPFGYTGGTTYSLNGGAWTAVDSEIVDGSADPYTFTITIDSLTIDADTTIDLDFGNVG
jgi:hypothetical protein